MLRRYPGADVKEMPVDDGISLLTYALEKEEDDKLFARWIGFAQYDISFEEFKEKLKPVVVNEKETMERLDELMAGTTWGREPIRSD